MEKAKKAITSSLINLDLNNKNPNNSKFGSNSSKIISSLYPSGFYVDRKKRPPSLVSLCLGVVGKCFEDIVPDLDVLAATFPSDIKMALTAIARRRKLLNDEVIISLADSSWQILDISGSDVSDYGLAEVAKMCSSIRAIDISWCDNITAAGVSDFVQHCHSLEILRCGGNPRSEVTARRCLGIFKSMLTVVEGDSWEELDTTEMANGSQSLRWLVWPTIDKDSLETLANECPRISVNPKASPLGFRGIEVPKEALPDASLDDHIVKDIDPNTWAVWGRKIKTSSPTLHSPNELSIAEKFRLAFVERDNRLARKRAKNARQHQRRAEREWMTTSATGKALSLAKQLSKSLNGRSRRNE